MHNSLAGPALNGIWFHDNMIPAHPERSRIAIFLSMSTQKDSKNPANAHEALTHFDASGQAHMVDIGDKKETHRIAIATGVIRMKPETLAIIQSGAAKKGDVLGVARIAAIMGAKK